MAPPGKRSGPRPHGGRQKIATDQSAAFARHPAIGRRTSSAGTRSFTTDERCIVLLAALLLALSSVLLATVVLGWVR